MSREARPSPVDVMNQMAVDFIRRGLAHHVTDDVPLDGRTISLAERPMVNFGSCSYMGLEAHPALAAGVKEAVDRYGTQFSSSRAFISVAPYAPLEAMLRQMFDKPVIVSATTTLGHFAALPILVRDEDAVILDLQVHHSVQTAAQLLKARGIALHIIRHNDMDQLEHKIRQLQNRHPRIWYLADGVYSMFGDFAPMDTLTDFMNRYEGFHTYIDDAHGMSWAGRHGTGIVRMHPHHDKMVLAVSLNKAFAAAGGALVFPTEAMAAQVRNCGGTMIFSGPIQPPMLGAALASARLHLSPEWPDYQAEFMELIDFTNQHLDDLGLPQYQVTRSPLFFVPMGLPRLVANLVHRILGEGFYVNMATFPATPMRQGGLRFMLNRNLTRDDVTAMLECVRHHYPLALAEEGSTPQQVARTFDIAPFRVRPDAGAATDEATQPAPEAPAGPPLAVEHVRSIEAVDAALWDDLFAHRGNFTHRGLALLEEVFTQDDVPENVWDFHYLTVRDAEGALVLATFFTVALVKDDMAAEGRISRQIEALRRSDPYYLTSRAVMLGCLISKGEHLHLDREHAQWREALACLLNTMQAVREAADANQVLLREFCTGADETLRQHMLDQGFVEVPLGNTLQVRELGWADHDAYLRGLGSKYRYNVRKEVLAYADQFELVTEPPWAPDEIADCYALYEQVFERSFDLNVFELPERFFAAMCAHPDYDVMRLYLVDDPRPPLERRPVAVMFSFVGRGLYSALIVGLDDDWLRSQNTYKQILYLTVQRAHELGCEVLDLAYTAELEKKKVGARPYPMCAYAQVEDLYHHTLIESMTLDGSLQP